MSAAKRAALLGPAIFGAFDGANTIIGVVRAVPPGAVMHTALLGAVSAGVSMAAGAFLSQRGKDGSPGVVAALVLGVATAVGTILPALPYTMLAGWWALLGVGVVLAVVGAGISVARTRLADDGLAPTPLARSVFETFLILILVCAAVAVVAAVTPGGGA